MAFRRSSVPWNDISPNLQSLRTFEGCYIEIAITSSRFGRRCANWVMRFLGVS